MFVRDGWGPVLYVRRDCQLEKELYDAVFRNDVCSVEDVLNRGLLAPSFDIDYKVNNVTALFLAVTRSNVANVEVLLDMGANVFTTSLSGRTLLHVAASRISDTPCICELLLQKIKSVSSDEGYLEFINCADSKGKTALDYANELGHPNISQILQREGAVIER